MRARLYGPVSKCVNWRRLTDRMIGLNRPLATRPPQLQQQGAGENVTARRAIVVDTAAAGSERRVQLPKHARTLHEFPAGIARVRSYDQLTHRCLEVSVARLQAACLLVCDRDFGKMTAIGAAITASGPWRAAVLRLGLATQRAKQTDLLHLDVIPAVEQYRAAHDSRGFGPQDSRPECDDMCAGPAS